MALGSLLQATIGDRRMPLAASRRMPPWYAASAALGAYLERAVWLVTSDVPGQDRPFRLNQSIIGWPNEDKELDQPSVSITVISDERQAHNFTPTMLESTWNQFAPNTVLWKTSEREITLQLDFWLTNVPERLAIESGLDEYFCPTEIRRGIMLEGPAEYWSQPIRYYLQSARGSEQTDGSDLVLGRNRMLLARVVAHVDDLQLRGAVTLDPRITLSVDDGPIEPVFPRPAGE